MISRKFDFALLISLPLLWFFFYLMPLYLLPADCSTGNFIFAENLARTGIFTFDALSKVRFDDSSNYLFVLVLSMAIKFLGLTTYKAALFVNAASLLLSVFFLHRAVASRFVSVHLLLIGLFFMSAQVWAGILGDEVLFQGLLYIMAIRAFWKHRYTMLMIWASLNVMARPDSILYILPLIVASYWDIRLLKDREKPRFIRRRILKTVLWLIVPVVAFGAWRAIYFGQALPWSWKHAGDTGGKTWWIFDLSSVGMVKHYLRFYVLPLLIGVLFYFVKEYKQLPARYYALLLGFVVMPVLYTATFAQDQNLGFKNYYPVYLGLMTLALFFIRDYRSISQAFFTAVFVFAVGFPKAKEFFIKALQKGTDNLYAISNELNAVPNGKLIAYFDNFITWNTDWQTTFANARHTPSPKQAKMSREDILNTEADIILPDGQLYLDDFKEKYDRYSVPHSTRQYQRQQPPDNSIDRFFYEYTRKLPLKAFGHHTLLVWKYGNNQKAIAKILAEYGGKKVE